MKQMDLREIEGVSGGINLEDPTAKFSHEREMGYQEWERLKELLSTK